MKAGWHGVDEIKKKGGSLQLRCRDFLEILSEAQRFYEWKKSIPSSIPESQLQKFQPLLNCDEAQPGLFIEFVIINRNIKT